jgi:hypothetical protein
MNKKGPSIPTAAATVKKTVANKNSKEAVVYVGPTIIGVAKQNTVYNNGIPAALKAAIEESPIIGNLVIPTNKLPMALKEIASKQGAMQIYFDKAKQYNPKKGA